MTKAKWEDELWERLREEDGDESNPMTDGADDTELHPFPEEDYHGPAVIGYVAIAAVLWIAGGLIWYFCVRP